MAKTHIAVDLGASSGRVIRGTLDAGRLLTEEIARFDNVPVRLPAIGDPHQPPQPDVLHWDVLRLWDAIARGLRACGTREAVASVGVDTWGVDYGLLDQRGQLLANPVHYRDQRTTAIASDFLEHVGASAYYARTGVHVQPFNTVFQLVAEAHHGLLGASGPSIAQLLLMPDLLTGWLCGQQFTELTNASTTGLLDPATRDWDGPTLAALHILTGTDPRALLAPLVEPGTILGPVRDGYGIDGAQAVAVGSHDTASAVVAVPLSTPRSAYISSGTWSLVGVELDAPIRSSEARAANFTNELGAFGTVRFLRNVAGLWLVQECLRTWSRPDQLPQLLRAARTIAPLQCVLDVNDPAFAVPGDMPARIATAAHTSGQHVPQSPPETLRAICDSLALAYRRAIRTAEQLTGREIDTVHIVGGGSRNTLLCQLTADATGLPVIAGPAEGTAVGNLLVQASALGELPSDLTVLREIVAASHELTRYLPTGDLADWDRAERRLAEATSPTLHERILR